MPKVVDLCFDSLYHNTGAFLVTKHTSMVDANC